MAQRKNVKTRNPLAKIVRQNPLFRKRIVPGAKLYSRNTKHKPTKGDYDNAY